METGKQKSKIEKAQKVILRDLQIKRQVIENIFKININIS